MFARRQIEMEAWRTLGYSSWTAMREAEYGGAAVMLPTGSRPRVTERLKAIEVGKTARGGSKHLTDQEVANTLGVSRSQVQDDLNGNNKKSRSGQNIEPADVIDAEVIEDDDQDHTVASNLSGSARHASGVQRAVRLPASGSGTPPALPGTASVHGWCRAREPPW